MLGCYALAHLLRYHGCIAVVKTGHENSVFVKCLKAGWLQCSDGCPAQEMEELSYYQ